MITSRWQRWLFPACCAVPYLGILFWLLSRGLIWVAQVLLAPLVMGGVGWNDSVVGQAGVPQQPSQVIIGEVLEYGPCGAST